MLDTNLSLFTALFYPTDLPFSITFPNNLLITDVANTAPSSIFHTQTTVFNPFILLSLSWSCIVIPIGSTFYKFVNFPLKEKVPHLFTKFHSNRWVMVLPLPKSP